FGDLHLYFPGHENAAEYRRELDLDSALATIRYRLGGVTYERQAFASHPDQVMVVRLSADRPGSLTFTAKLDSPHPSARAAARGQDQLILAGQIKEDGLRLEARLRVVPQGGRVSA